MVFPDANRNQRLGMLLALVGDPPDLLLNLRLRDGWVEKGFGETADQPVICVYTRNGGGNREHFCDGANGPCTACWGEDATKHPAYLADADDGFDPTYRTYRFKVGNPHVTPDIIATLLEAAQDEPVNMSERWRQAIDAIGRT